MSYFGTIKIDGTEHLVGSTLYGTCSTGASTQQKEVTLANFDQIQDGVTVHVKFTNSNTHASATLKVGSTDAKPIYRNSSRVGTTVATSWAAGSVVAFTYDGTNWVMNTASDTDENTTYTFAEGTTDGAFSVTPSGSNAQTVNVHNVMPKSGGTFSGNVSFDSGKTLTVNAPSADSHAATKKYVDDSIGNVLGAADSMVFKGTLGTGGTITAVLNGNASANPSQAYQAGWTYKVITAGTYAGQVCEVGDLLIAIHDSTSGQTAVNNDHWVVAQTNIDGAVTTNDGADGYLAKFTGTHTIAKLVAISNNGTGFLKEDGTWATPTNDRDPGYGKITPGNNSSTTDALTGNTTQISAGTYNENLKLTGANKWIVLAGTSGTSNDNDEIKIAHFVPGTGITNSGPSSAQTGTRGSTFNIPKIAIDEAGHVTGITSVTVSLPASDNTDEKVKQTPYTDGTTNSTFNLLFKKTTGDTTTTNDVYYSTVSGKQLTFNPSTGTLSSAIFSGTFSGTLAATDVKTALGVDANETGAVFLHKTGAWKTLSLGTIASIANGVLTITNVGITVT